MLAGVNFGWVGGPLVPARRVAGQRLSVVVPAAVCRVFWSILTRTRVPAIVHIVRVHLQLGLRPH